MAVITDRKRPVFKQSQVFSGGGGGLFGNILGGLSSLVNTFQAFVPEIVSTTEYYPGGSIMPGRSFGSNSYRFGYQGSEKDDEISRSGNSFPTFFRQGDTRLLRLWRVDPMSSKFPSLSPYMSMDRNPILMNDIKGLCPRCPNDAKIRRSAYFGWFRIHLRW